MKCQNCGAPLEEGTKFCYDCGTDVTVTNMPTETPVVDVDQPVVEPVQENVVIEEPVAEVIEQQEVSSQTLAPETSTEAVPTVNVEVKAVAPEVTKKNKTLLTIALIAIVLALLVAAFYVFKDYFM